LTDANIFIVMYGVTSIYFAVSFFCLYRYNNYWYRNADKHQNFCTSNYLDLEAILFFLFLLIPLKLSMSLFVFLLCVYICVAAAIAK